MPSVHWLERPEEHDFPAARSYLTLLTDDAVIAHLIATWRGASVVHYKAKDILRAARLPLLPADNEHVASDLKKIHHGEAMSPLLLVRGSLTRAAPLEVADGYHRVCASYYTEENTDVPCLIASADAVTSN